MASRTALNARNLEVLGAARLAAILMELSAGDGAAQRWLRLELAGAQGAGEVAREVRRRLGQVARARGFVDWRRKRALIDDLDAQRRAVTEKIATEDPAEALDLLWRFPALAGSVHERCDEGEGLVGALFREALADLGEVARPRGPARRGWRSGRSTGCGTTATPNTTAWSPPSPRRSARPGWRSSSAASGPGQPCQRKGRLGATPPSKGAARARTGRARGPCASAGARRGWR